MGLRKEKPAAQPPQPAPPVDEKAIDRFIERGGGVAVSDKPRKASNFPLRFLHEDTARRIDRSRKKRAVAPSINAWINEAILDKLKAEE